MKLTEGERGMVSIGTYVVLAIYGILVKTKGKTRLF